MIVQPWPRNATLRWPGGVATRSSSSLSPASLYCASSRAFPRWLKLRARLSWLCVLPAFFPLFTLD